MTRRYRALIGLNVVLLGVLAMVVFAPSAGAEQEARRNPGTYTMVTGRSPGSTEGAIWIIDASNQEMLVTRYNQSRKSLEMIGYRDLGEDASGQVRRGR